MTLLSRCMNFFPTFHLLCIAFAGGLFFSEPSVNNGFILLFCLYLLPILCLRLHNAAFSFREGTTDLARQRYSAWWGSHQIQAVFNAVPLLEGILRLVPGLYSNWLRLWGSKIGRQVYWTPQVDITDRHLLKVGNNVIFGHKVACYSHVIIQRRHKMLLYVKRITIGDNVFIGAGSRLGPGTKIADFVTLPLLTDLKINQNIGEPECQAGE